MIWKTPVDIPIPERMRIDNLKQLSIWRHLKFYFIVIDKEWTK